MRLLFVLCLLPFYSNALSLSPPLRYFGVRQAPAMLHFKGITRSSAYLAFITLPPALGMESKGAIDLIFASEPVPGLATETIENISIWANGHSTNGLSVVLDGVLDRMTGFLLPLDSFHAVLSNDSNPTSLYTAALISERLKLNSDENLAHYLNELSMQKSKVTLRLEMVSGKQVSIYIPSPEDLKDLLDLTSKKSYRANPIGTFCNRLLGRVKNSPPLTYDFSGGWTNLSNL